MRTLILLKPDVFVQRLWGTAMGFLQNDTDFAIRDARYFHPCIPTTLKLDAHYAEHHGKDFYAGLMEFMVSGNILALTGETFSIPNLRSHIAQFRIKWAEGGPRNLIHCSDSPEAGERETSIWFPS